VFDSSYDRGSPTSFAPNQVIKGWTEAMQLMVEGDIWELTIPSELAYADHGSGQIPGGAVLVFKLNLIKIEDEDTKVPAIKCDPITKENCNEKEVKFISKIGDWDDAKKGSELQRLQKLSSSDMKPDLRDWFIRRVKILTKLVTGTGKEEL
jgi:FKBP-type peptidyl-prolyl cis-trans isomerase